MDHLNAHEIKSRFPKQLLRVRAGRHVAKPALDSLRVRTDIFPAVLGQLLA